VLEDPNLGFTGDHNFPSLVPAHRVQCELVPIMVLLHNSGRCLYFVSWPYWLSEREALGQIDNQPWELAYGRRNQARNQDTMSYLAFEDRRLGEITLQMDGVVVAGYGREHLYVMIADNSGGSLAVAFTDLFKSLPHLATVLLCYPVFPAIAHSARSLPGQLAYRT
jgi:hypothetical protein